MTEYTGVLIGGPEDSNVLTATVTKIPVENTTKIYVDGPDKPCFTFLTKGCYLWREADDTTAGYFYWKLESLQSVKEPRSE